MKFIYFELDNLLVNISFARSFWVKQMEEKFQLFMEMEFEESNLRGQFQEDPMEEIIRFLKDDEKSILFL